MGHYVDPPTPQPSVHNKYFKKHIPTDEKLRFLMNGVNIRRWGERFWRKGCFFFSPCEQKSNEYNNKMKRKGMTFEGQRQRFNTRNVTKLKKKLTQNLKWFSEREKAKKKKKGKEEFSQPFTYGTVRLDSSQYSRL